MKETERKGRKAAMSGKRKAPHSGAKTGKDKNEKIRNKRAETRTHQFRDSLSMPRSLENEQRNWNMWKMPNDVRNDDEK